jgi:hypothetical protein
MRINQLNQSLVEMSEDKALSIIMSVRFNRRQVKFIPKKEKSASQKKSTIDLLSSLSSDERNKLIKLLEESL